MTDTLTHRLIATDPIIEDRYQGNNRAIDYKWLLIEEEDNDEDERETLIRRVHVVMTVEHHGKPEYGNRDPFSFTARLGIDERWHGNGMVRMKIGIGQPVPVVTIGKQEGVQRFSRKRLEEFAENMLVELRNMRDDDRVRAMFGEV